jgi:hypothetical protein
MTSVAAAGRDWPARSPRGGLRVSPGVADGRGITSGYLSDLVGPRVVVGPGSLPGPHRFATRAGGAVPDRGGSGTIGACLRSHWRTTTVAPTVNVRRRDAVLVGVPLAGPASPVARLSSRNRYHTVPKNRWRNGRRRSPWRRCAG